MGRKRKGYLQILVYLPEAVHRAFKTMAAEQGFAMSEWLATQAEEAAVEAGYYKPKLVSEYSTLAELLKAKRKYVEKSTKIPAEILDVIEQGEKPDELNLLRLGMALDISQSDLENIYERSFPKEKKKES